MNAAFLLVTTAWMTGDVPAAGAKVAPAPAPGPHVAAPIAHGSCGGCCESSCCEESFGHKLRHRLHGLFNRGGHGCCEASCCQPAPTCCDDGCGHGHRHRLFRGHRHHRNDCCESSCQPAPTCCDNGCGHGHGNGGLFGRLFSRHHRSDCCESSCGNGCCGANGAIGGTIGAPVQGTMPRVGEPIQAPKKMPQSGPRTGGDAPAKEVRIITPPSGNPIPAPTTPALETAPAIVPSLDADNRNPF